MLDQKRIELENKSLQNRIQKMGTKGQSIIANAVYGAQGTVDPVAAINEVAAAKIESRVKEQDAKERGAKAVKASYDDILQAHTRIKKEVADIEKENQSLKAHLSKLKLHVKKYEMSTERLRKDVSHLPAASRPGTSREDADQKGRKPGATKGDQDGEDLSRITDNELRDLIIENQGLQELRRTMVERTKNAKVAVEKAGVTARRAGDEEGVARRRIEMICPGTVDLSADEK
jgi:hypothetical protein